MKMSQLHPKWKPRTRDVHRARSYLRRVRRVGHVGAVRVEIPSGAKRGRSARRLDVKAGSGKSERSAEQCARTGKIESKYFLG